jgi:hypothetical protein
MALIANTNRCWAPLGDASIACRATDVYICERGDSLAKYAVVGSSVQRNGSFEGISGHLEAKRFSQPCIEKEGDLIEVMMSVNG